MTSDAGVKAVSRWRQQNENILALHSAVVAPDGAVWLAGADADGTFVLRLSGVPQIREAR